MRQFIKDFSEDMNKWLEESVVESIVEPKIGDLQSEIDERLAIIKSNFQSFDDDIGATLHEQLQLSNLSIADSLTNIRLNLTGSSFFTKVAEMISGAIGATVKLFFGEDLEEKRRKIKAEILDKNTEQLLKDFDKNVEEICKRIKENFDAKADNFHKSADASISILCTLLEQEEQAMQKTVEQKEAGAAIIKQKSFQLQAIETTLSGLTKTALG